MRGFLYGLFGWLGGFFIALSIKFYKPDTRAEEQLQSLLNDISESATREEKRNMFTGSCFPVSNFNPHPAANREYYVAALRNAHDSNRTDIYMFTEKELIRAQDRADKNTEDIPSDIADYNQVIERTED